MARDVATMFDELKPWLTAMPRCTPTGRGFRRNWNRRAPNWQGRGGHGGGGSASDGGQGLNAQARSSGPQ